MDPQDLLRLADEVEKATGPDPMVDLAVYQAVTGQEGIVRCMGREGISAAVPVYTASLDAAKALIGADAYWRLGNDGEGPDVSAFKATVTSGDGPTLAFHDAVAATPALALCAAALKARAHSTKESDNG